EHGARPFLIGDTVLRGSLASQAEALRDMAEPNKGLEWQPAKMSEIPSQYGSGCTPSATNDNCGVHILSGIPNRAAALMIRSLGWNKTQRLFYRVMTERLRTDSDFADYRNQLLGECSTSLSAGDCQ